MGKVARSSLFLIGTFAVLAFAGAAAATSGAHFFSTSESINAGGSLVVSWDEAGVGQQTVAYTLTANGSATYACLNGGGNHPQAANKATFAGPVSASGSFPATKNGRVTGTLTAGPPGSGSFSCPGGQTLILASVSYTSITLTDNTNGVTVSLADTSRTFFNV